MQAKNVHVCNSPAAAKQLVIALYTYFICSILRIQYTARALRISFAPFLLEASAGKVNFHEALIPVAEAWIMV